MSDNTKTNTQALVGLLLVSWVNALVLLWHRQSLFSEAPAKASFCNISSYFNCDAVALSSYSSFLSIPTAAWAMAFYGVLLLLALYSLSKPKEYFPTLALGSFVALIPTGFQAFNSFVVIKAACVLCLFSYVLNIVIAIFAFQGLRKLGLPLSSGLGQLKKFGSCLWGTIAAIVLVTLFLPSIVSGMQDARPIDQNLVKAAMDSYDMASVKTFSYDNSPSMGASAENAKVTIVEFSDFQCPFCARSAALLPSLIKPYEDRVRWVYKNFPLDPSCNTKIQGAGHSLSCLAAKVGRCVFEKSGSPAFFAYKKEAFENQTKLSVEYLKTLGQNHSGLDSTSLETCLNDTKTNDAVLRDIQEGDAAGVQGTPALYFNGKSFQAGPQPRLLKELLEKLLKN